MLSLRTRERGDGDGTTTAHDERSRCGGGAYSSPGPRGRRCHLRDSAVVVVFRVVLVVVVSSSRRCSARTFFLAALTASARTSPLRLRSPARSRVARGMHKTGWSDASDSRASMFGKYYRTAASYCPRMRCVVSQSDTNACGVVWPPPIDRCGDVGARKPVVGEYVTSAR